MNILFMCPRFHGYYKRMINILEKKGNIVEYYDLNNNIGTSFLDRIKDKISSKLLYKKFDKKYYDFLNNKKNILFDRVVVIFGGPYFRKDNVNELKKYFSSAEFIFYNWDSVINNLNSKDYYSLFDKYYSFDPEDCKQYGYALLQNFYIENSESNPLSKYDYGVLMTFGKPKIKNYLKIKEALPPNVKGKEYLIMNKKSSYIFRYILNHKDFKKVDRNNLYFKFLSLNDSLTFYNDCKAVIDVPLENQNGLTTRTFEVLKQQKKLITTNKYIKKYDFYTPTNIFIVDDQNKKIPNSFFETPFDKNYSIGAEYSLESFVIKLFDLGN